MSNNREPSMSITESQHYISRMSQSNEMIKKASNFSNCLAVCNMAACVIGSARLQQIYTSFSREYIWRGKLPMVKVAIQTEATACKLCRCLNTWQQNTITQVFSPLMLQKKSKITLISILVSHNQPMISWKTSVKRTTLRT